MSNSLDPAQDRYCVGPDLGPNCLQRLTTYDKSGAGCVLFLLFPQPNKVYLLVFHSVMSFIVPLTLDREV